ncbi:hypothetical protein BpHYR1_025928 [Brachionus plicatilis]|uniref:Uncharacterized protein n=1 Tax=Brachionus plicatilis TaxID=10195 RepID=A0A3M7SMA9_BRAPC|nr:hypothetical protein BpHYR1_025928 [Brachionus plicatilis]
MNVLEGPRQYCIGVRPVQSYHAFNCPAEIRVTCKKREKNKYAITKCNLTHDNHPTGKDIFLFKDLVLRVFVDLGYNPIKEILVLQGF